MTERMTERTPLIINKTGIPLCNVSLIPAKHNVLINNATISRRACDAADFKIVISSDRDEAPYARTEICVINVVGAKVGETILELGIRISAKILEKYEVTSLFVRCVALRDTETSKTFPSGTLMMTFYESVWNFCRRKVWRFLHK